VAAETTGVAAAGEERPEAAAPIAGDPALDAIASVRVRVGAELPAARQEALVAALHQIGIDEVRVEALEIVIAASRVGFYRAEDRAAAEALARAMAPVVTGGAAIAVRDYGALAPRPGPGRLDLWVRE
jgi:ribosomal protein L12E/L44/L45/RPP1/RPP2